MKQRWLAVALITLYTLSGGYSFAQTRQVKFKHLGIDQGLSHPEIRSIVKDNRGFIWVGTSAGLDRFDGYTVKSFFFDPRDTTSLINDAVIRVLQVPDGLLVVHTQSGTCIYNPAMENFDRHPQGVLARYGTSVQLTSVVRDVDGSYWFVEPGKLVRYNEKEQKITTIQHVEGDSSTIAKTGISEFATDKYGNYWLIHSDGLVEKIQLTRSGHQVVKRVRTIQKFNKSNNAYYRITCDSDGDLWLCAPGLSQGIFFYDNKRDRLQPITTDTSPLKLNSNAVSVVIEAPDRTLWVGTDHGGINIIDKRNSGIRYVRHREGDALSLAENSITAFHCDDQGIIWVGTYKRGVSYYHENIYRFQLYKHYALDPTSLPFEDVNEFAEDAKGNLWIGTNGGGLLYLDRKTGTFRQYLSEPGNENSISANVIVSLLVDSDQNLWIGSYKGGLDKFDGKKFTRYKYVEGDNTSLPSPNIWEIFEDSRKRLWIGTIEAGAALFDRTTGKTQRIPLWGPNAMQSPTIEVIDEDRHGNIWFGTVNGIDVLSNDNKTFIHYGVSTDKHSLSHNSIMDLLRDTRGRMWVATSDGLNLYDESIDGFRVYREVERRNSILGILEDEDGHFWMTTLEGLSEMTLVGNSVDSVSFKRYTIYDGVQGSQFNHNASFKTTSGELVFGGPTGFNILSGSERKIDVHANRIAFSELELYERPVGIGEVISGVVVLNRSIVEASQIVLPPNKNFFSIKVSAFNYFNPERDRYLYKLEGLKTDWLPLDRRNHEIVFNSLNPGKYKLRVKVVNSDGISSDDEAVLTVVIQPPFWKTKTAFGLYVLLLLLILYITRRQIQQREKLKFAFEQERREIQRIHELDMMKVKFFTNVSHEFRTPLTLILTPIERIISKTKDPDQLNQFQLIQRNAKRLLNLVNQLLDFKKLEVHEIKLNQSKGDIITFIRETTMSFSDLSEKKGIRLEFRSTVPHLETFFDQDKLEKILFNLLSNAFKFTLEGGVVTVHLENSIKDGDHYLEIKVADTGIGIPADKLDKIFEPFFQTDLPKSIVNVGSGIGLSITKEFVRILGGRITVTSEPGKGSTFTVVIPVKDIVAEAEVLSQVPAPIAQGDGEELPVSKHKRKSLLLVEDNDDFRFYLKDNLKYQYTIHEAKNGAEGWERALALQPDLIVSDIMMPEINGIELCKRIKSDERVSHIPVILLTARSSEEQRLEGFKTGADDYITKPFNFEVLEARINNLLSQREKFQKNFRGAVEVKSSELQITPLDVKFIENAVKCVEKNVSSPDFSVEDFGRELGISRAYVFKKILALTGKTPLEFIRSIRLQHAAQLLEKSQLSVREVAYKVGFNNPKYFTKYFKEQFRVLPSDYVASKKREEHNQ